MQAVVVEILRQTNTVQALEFVCGKPLTVVSTDITYLPGRDGFSYLSGIIDCETDVVLAHVTSNSMEEQFVLDTYDQLKSYELPDDIKKVAVPTLAHRLMMTSSARLKLNAGEEVIKEIVDKAPVPTETVFDGMYV